MKKTSRLGRGLNALIPEHQDTPPAGSNQISQINVGLIKANPYQPRLEFDQQALEELKTSIKEKGIIQPLTVRKKNEHYELIAGERRLRAVTQLGIEKVPAYIIEVDSKEEMLELAIIENVQREKLNPIEQATAYQRLIDECSLTQEEVARKIGKERTTITNILRLLKLPEQIQESVKKEEISMGHARALLSIEDAGVQQEVWRKTIKEALSVRKAEQLAKQQHSRHKTEKAVKPKRSVFLQKVEQELREILGTKVVVHSRKEGGSIEVEFYSPEDLNRLIEIFDKLKD